MKAKVVVLEESVTRFKDLEAGEVFFFPKETEFCLPDSLYMKVEPECGWKEGHELWNMVELNYGNIYEELPDTVVIPAKNVELRVGR
jgi:hypothetical protein